MSISQSEIVAMLDDCMNRDHKLTTWEQDFIAGLADRGYPLTARQQDILEEIWDRVTS